MEDDLVNVVGEITATGDKIRERAGAEGVAKETAATLAEVEASALEKAGRIEVTIADGKVTRLALQTGWLERAPSYEVERVIAATVNDCLENYQAALGEAMQKATGDMGEMFQSLKALDSRLDAAYERAMARIDGGEALW
ncbi:YbaB/EbfC family nucleoid-associated protein [Mariniluteicoccus flavus]